MKKYMRFYKLYDWILEEMGASTDAALISIIHSFSEMGQECKLSYKDFADILKVKRRNAILRIQKLIAAGYITVSEHEKETNVYSVCVEKFKHDSDENITTPSDENITTPSDENITTPSDENITTPSDENITTYHKREIKENIKRGGERARNAEPLKFIKEHEAIKLTEKQYAALQRDVSGTGRSLESYFRSLEKHMKSKGKSYEPHFETLRDWMQRDKDKAEQNSKAKPEAAEDSSIDMNEINKLLQPYSPPGAVEDPAQDARTAQQSRRPADGHTLPRS